MKRSYALILSSFLMFFCKVGNWHGNGTKNAVISTLFNQRMLLLVKGTYATDNPIGFEAYSGGTGQLYQDTSGEGFDPTLGLAGVPLAQNLPIFIDIGEIRMSTKYQEGTFDLSLIKNVKDTKKFWDEVAPNRQVFLYDSLYYQLEFLSFKRRRNQSDSIFQRRGSRLPFERSYFRNGLGCVRKRSRSILLYRFVSEVFGDRLGDGTRAYVFQSHSI